MSKTIDEKVINLSQLSLVVWILDVLRNAPAKGVTLKQFQKMWQERTGGKEKLTRGRFSRHCSYTSSLFGVNVVCPTRKYYRIENPEALTLNTLANDLLASVQEYMLIDEFRDLGSRLQPAQILSGRHYLTSIAHSIRHRKKLAIRYQKFTDSEPYDAVIHPYVLKAIQGRWYVLAFKENSEHADANAQMFALDRTLSLEIINESFEFDKSVDPDSCFDDFFGAYLDPLHFPVQDIYIVCASWVAPYIRTLPIHKSQIELATYQLPDNLLKKADTLSIEGADKGIVFFRYHISPSPDFMAEIARWGNSCVVLN